MVLINSGDSRLDAAIESWLKYDKNPHTRQEVLDDIKKSKWDKLRKTMMSRQKFGTAGLRGRMAAGYMCMNDVVVLQTAQGLCSYIQKTLDQNRLKNGIVIGFDGRYNSKRWAEFTAKVFLSASIPVHIFSDVCPTPLVSFATILYEAAAGVMVTASHNPKEDNGYKVFWKNGSQVIAPHDDEIMDEIYNCLEIPDEHWNIEEIWTHDMVKDCLKEVTTKYMEYIKSSYHEEVLEKNKSANISVVYSAMHGVGYKYILKAFEAANLKEPISVIEQQNIDPEFSTVTFPNPEEKECLKLSKSLAESKGVKLVLVNDPDADRLAVAEFDHASKSWKVFSGNEMGALLGWWILEQHCAHSDVQGENKLFILSSIVSSKMLRTIAKGRAQFVETLTGFKWMGNAALLLLQQGCTPIFAFEEAIGYMVNPRIPDKDGVSAAVQVASLASKLYSSGSSLLKMLQELYVKYGFHVSYNSYFIVHDQAVLSRIFSKIRNYHGPSEYPKKVGSMELTLVHDFTTGVKIPEQSNAEGRRLSVLGTGLETNASGEMILLQCANGLSVTVRTSGTEPKLKFYTELVCTAPTHSEQEAKKVELEEMVKEFINELIQPEEHGLEWR